MKALKQFIFGGAVSMPFGGEFGLFLARLFVGFSMAFAHGLGKIQDPSKVIEGAGKMGFPMPEFFGWAAAFSEFGFALLLAVGLATRPSALMLIATMSTAAFIAHGADPYGKKELALLYLAFSVVYLFFGGGRWSLDSLIVKRK
ncbi:MAG: DoxX family protein [bacterium]